jgi:hypothetical protein
MDNMVESLALPVYSLAGLATWISFTGGLGVVKKSEIFGSCTAGLQIKIKIEGQLY